jgi:pimeloyl-ACP methyl ester carboxylesterase
MHHPTPVNYKAHNTIKGRIDVGGYCLAFEYSGERTDQDSPSVVLEAGLGVASDTWDFIWPEITAFTRAFRYDRAGLGQSDPGPHPRTSGLIVDELHTLLKKAEIPGPYVLAGHSFGGLNMQLYASRYSHEVVGLVLIDSAFPKIRSELEALLPLETPNENPALHEYRRYLRDVAAYSSEEVDRSACDEQVQAGKIPNSLPLVALSSTLHTLPPKFSDDFPSDIANRIMLRIQELAAEFVARSSRSTHIIAENSGHFIQIDRPDLVIDAIRQIVETVQTANRSKQEAAAQQHRHEDTGNRE